MLTLKFLDGTPVDDNYANLIAALNRSASHAIELISEDELEDFSRRVLETHEEDRSATA